MFSLPIGQGSSGTPGIAVNYRPGAYRFKGPFFWRIFGVIVTILISLVIFPIIFLLYTVLALIQMVLTMNWLYQTLVGDNWYE